MVYQVKAIANKSGLTIRVDGNIYQVIDGKVTKTIDEGRKDPKSYEECFDVACIAFKYNRYDSVEIDYDSYKVN